MSRAAFRQGFRAQRGGYVANPYAPGTREASDWARGWVDAHSSHGAPHPLATARTRPPRILRRLAAVAAVACAMSGCATPAQSRWALPDGSQADPAAMGPGLTACLHNPACKVWGD